MDVSTIWRTWIIHVYTFVVSISKCCAYRFAFAVELLAGRFLARSRVYLSSRLYFCNYVSLHDSLRSLVSLEIYTSL